ncbi:hypothetical protein [Macrococcoides bohemicum]|uniref:hypothetical protein n=1 Tax=Macrococcoides bohemicum TaxID=1903056 RepID=UPI00165E19AD|nr:hypothetical protein [Macrococcus bohemicus]MBC9874925.1 hypothetical protein [Macrococcus bohemicus]
MDVELLKKSLGELATQLGDNKHNTVSVSLLLLELGLRNEDFEKLLLNFNRLIMNSDTQIFEEYHSEVQKVLPEASNLITIRIIDGFSKEYIPQLREFAIQLKEEML